MKKRIEKDSLGTKPVPSEAYYGVETVRALENFPISGIRFHPSMTNALASVKKACAVTNLGLKRLDAKRARAIIRACDEILAGKWHDHFLTDVLQSGAGVSAHMNANEVIANRALELLGRKKGDYAYLNPHDHVNMGQSTNDVIPTAIRLAALKSLTSFYQVSDELARALAQKAYLFRKVVKSGRTHLQDAAPITLGQEFSGWARQIEKAAQRVRLMAANLLELGIGGSAVGTGLNTTLVYRRLVIQQLKKITGFSVKSAPNLFEVMQSDADLAAVSGSLRDFALSLIQISNDLRLLSSGPQTGFNEIQLPTLQPGSSIMPGKVNPVIPEMTTQVCFQVMGNDVTIAFAASAGQLELNVMRPVIAHNLLHSIEILTNAMKQLTQKCVKGIQANAKRCRENAEKSFGIAAALNPYLGYEKVAACVKEALAKGKTLREVVLSHGWMSARQLDKILSVENLTQPKRR